MIPEQIYLNVHRTHIKMIIIKHEKDGFELIQKADLTKNKVLLTFQRVVNNLDEQL